MGVARISQGESMTSLQNSNVDKKAESQILKQLELIARCQKYLTNPDLLKFVSEEDRQELIATLQEVKDISLSEIRSYRTHLISFV
jgi:hypothetical protein